MALYMEIFSIRKGKITNYLIAGNDFLVSHHFCLLVFPYPTVQGELSDWDEENEKGEDIATLNHHEYVKIDVAFGSKILITPNDSWYINCQVASIDLDHHDVYQNYD